MDDKLLSKALDAAYKQGKKDGFSWGFKTGQSTLSNMAFFIVWSITVVGALIGGAIIHALLNGDWLSLAM